jgi:hypothetical protein
MAPAWQLELFNARIYVDIAHNSAEFRNGLYTTVRLETN